MSKGEDWSKRTYIRYPGWTEEEKEKVREWIKAGMTYAFIGAQFNMTGTAAQHRCNEQLGIFSRNSGGNFKVSYSVLRYVSPPAPDDEPEPLGAIHDVVGYGQCRFIRADIPSDHWRMCGHKADGRFCDYHKRIVYAGKSRSKVNE